MKLKEKIKEFKCAYWCLKLKELKHRFKSYKEFDRMQRALSRFRECKDSKTQKQIKKEIRLCHKFWGCYPLHYYRYDLYRKEKELTEKELLQYIPEFFFYRLFLPFYNSGKYSILLRNKIIMEHFFRSLSIPQAKTICKIIKKRVYNNNLREMDYLKIEHDITTNNYRKIFVKPAWGFGGKGIVIFNRCVDGNYESQEGETFGKLFLDGIKARGDYIIQAGVEQSDELSAIYPQSLNTFRVCTENIKGNIRLLCATLRVGRSGKQVDNSSQDGIFLKVNIDNGELCDFATSEMIEHLNSHPDTKFVFKDYCIKDWEKVKVATKEAAKKLAQFTYLGWDIAISKNGPIAIEANLYFGLDLYQVALGGLKDTFNIADPSFYWKNLKKKMREFSN